MRVLFGLEVSFYPVPAPDYQVLLCIKSSQDGQASRDNKIVIRKPRRWLSNPCRRRLWYSHKSNKAEIHQWQSFLASQIRELTSAEWHDLWHLKYEGINIDRNPCECATWLDVVAGASACNRENKKQNQAAVCWTRERPWSRCCCCCSLFPSRDFINYLHNTVNWFKCCWFTPCVEKKSGHFVSCVAKSRNERV